MICTRLPLTPESDRKKWHSTIIVLDVGCEIINAFLAKGAMLLYFTFESRPLDPIGDSFNEASPGGRWADYLSFLRHHSSVTYPRLHYGCLLSISKPVRTRTLSDTVGMFLRS
jgi:hypothetical protein